MWKVVIPVLAGVFAVGLGVMVGGFRDIDVNDAGAKNALNFAIVEHNRRSNDAYLSQVAQVVRVQSQVVSGIKYLITVKMARSTCRKNNANDLCTIHQDPAKALPYECTFTVWSRPWLNDITMLNQQC
ncbi:cystatin C (amyloid angiopathy and cerebral hemorrhage) [Brachyistius frenatus]|uniref:cystatin C (amyloid angiopathy and cerebral hemorrhage) n=1 Tax=Brachyistius frenatus TaxID=100188 RepID=UPI0037E71D52